MNMVISKRVYRWN